MAIKLTQGDHQRIESFVSFVLEGYADQDVSLSHAAGAIAKLVSAAADDDETDMKKWLQSSEADWATALRKA
jgi:hypothetical protein